MANNFLSAGYYAGNQVIIHWAEERKWLRFRDPLEVFLASDPKEVVPILGHIEKEVETKKIYAAGFVAYEAGLAFDPALCFRAVGDFPLLWFGLFREAEPFTVPAVGGPPATLGAALPARRSCASGAAGGRAGPPVWSPAWQSSVTEQEYKKAIQTVKSLIVEGATYQVNYSYRLRAPFDGDALSYFLQVAGRQNIPYAAFVGTDRYAICSFSPELFFNLRGGVISSKPMKGTMPRGIFNADDEAVARALYLSEKNRAENVMIVDMVRNDIGRIAAPGTVAVPAMFDLEKYDTLWQMTSTVSARTSASLFQIFQALFPPASCTGAP
ncbi:MAG: chorismate-binding protein, partial [Kiritimatiellia bacterium]|nr:chorismate-binding protein [Kiritimatiellia bacterium]